MAWEERTVKAMREEFVQRVLAKEKSKAALCREYGISRPTGDKWIRRFQEGDVYKRQGRTPLRRPQQMVLYRLIVHFFRLLQIRPDVGVVFMKHFLTSSYLLV